MGKASGIYQTAEQTSMIATALAKATSEITAGIMSELATIKTTLAVNTVEIKNLVSKMDEMRNDLTVQVRDHESRLRRLELWGALAIGGLWILQLILGWYILHP